MQDGILCDRPGVLGEALHKKRAVQIVLCCPHPQPSSEHLDPRGPDQPHQETARSGQDMDFLPEWVGRGCGLTGPVTPLPPSWAQRMAQKRVLW